MIIQIDHPILGPQKTYTADIVTAGNTYTLVDNNDDFASGDLALFGKLGQEKTERVVLTGVTSVNQIDHSTGPLFDHPIKTPISQLLYDQAEVYSATAEGGTYSLLTTVNLNLDEEGTLYDDTSGTTSTWYKIRYKNSQTATVSDYSDEVQGTGYTENSLRSMADEVLSDFGDPDSKEVTREQVRKWLNTAVRKVTMQLIRFYPDYGGAYSTQALTSGTYSYPTNFLSFKRVNIGNSLSDSTTAIFMKESELDPADTYSEYEPVIFLRDTTWGVNPDCAGKTAYLYYWQYPTSMDDDADEHGLPYGARDVLVSYAVYKCWLNKDSDKASNFRSLYDDNLKEFLDFVAQSRQASNNYFQRISFGNEEYEV
jgi:hypothetical protein